MRIVTSAVGGRMVQCVVTAPLGGTVKASFGSVFLQAERVAVVESASASGLALVPTNRRNILHASTIGVGELISEALEWKPGRLVLFVGGTGTNDGGAGMAQKLGIRLLDASGRSIGLGGEALLRLAAIDLSRRDARLSTIPLECCGDVDNPLTGPSGASKTFGPQKGATPDDVQLLDDALHHLASVVKRDMGMDLEHVRGAGAGGGLGFGAMAFLGARFRMGVDFVADVLGLEARIRRADLTITGEGRLDASSLRGKAPSLVVRLAREHGVGTVLICGEVSSDLDLRSVGAMQLAAMVDRFGPRRPLIDARAALEDIAEELAQQISQR
jgi:glycerate 2-kinase